ncbi:hypothetical protein [Haliovirga abyssi]|uniref:OmpH family outer membrane protein n=1 Tax=Haliovirga abyssi TaxID=2996794 RepID=A0AAU9DIY8_9FUSO|nr:hypothetical protein [Haliovirga abyssi]BDU49797.1 hypothetical protein HLVA_03660 [Haliovirga abyssi]
MRKKVMVVILFSFVLSSFAGAADRELLKKVFDKYKKLKNYAIELNIENKSIKKDDKKLKKMMIDDYNKGIDLLNSLDTKENIRKDLSNAKNVEIYKEINGLLEKITGIIMNEMTDDLQGIREKLVSDYNKGISLYEKLSGNKYKRKNIENMNTVDMYNEVNNVLEKILESK